MLSFDPHKNEENIRKHGLALADAHMFDFEGAVEEIQHEEGRNASGLLELGMGDSSQSSFSRILAKQGAGSSARAAPIEQRS